MVALNIERREMKMIEKYIDTNCTKRNVYQLARESGLKTDIAMVAFENGADKKCVEIAINLLKSGMTVEFIHENTKLPIDEITKLKNSFSKEVME